MSTAKNLSKIVDKIDKKTKYIIFGYIKWIQKQFPNDYSFNIPLEIINIILIFYNRSLSFINEINNKYSPKKLQFVNDRTVKSIQTAGHYVSCIFGEEIYRGNCNKFVLHILWKKCIADFFMGFIFNLPVNDSLNNKFDFNERLSDNDKNINCSVGINVYKRNKCLKLYDKNNRNVALKYRSTKYFGQNDVFILSFDFNLNKLIIHHNGKKADTISINKYQSIIPAFSLDDKNEELEVIKWKFY